MKNLEKEINEWKQLLDIGEINQEIYELEIHKITKKYYTKKNKGKKPIKEKLENTMRTTKYFIPLFLILFLYSNLYVTKDIQYVESLQNISEPIQNKTSGNTEKIIDSTKVNINYVANYSMAGRVVDVQDYLGYNITNKLSPRDIGISWGFLTADKNNNHLKWTSTGNRFLKWSTNDGVWLSSVGGKQEVIKRFSNNHVIPSDKNIAKLIRNIKKDDFVRIDGYLVNVNYNTKNGGYFTWNSSTSRSDSGDGACEIIYVTNVTWLELN